MSPTAWGLWLCFFLGDWSTDIRLLKKHEEGRFSDPLELPMMVKTPKKCGNGCTPLHGTPNVDCGEINIWGKTYTLYLFRSGVASVSKVNFFFSLVARTQGFYPGSNRPEAKNHTSCMSYCIACRSTRWVCVAGRNLLLGFLGKGWSSVGSAPLGSCFSSLDSRWLVLFG
jgi:hypothetical protein